MKRLIRYFSDGICSRTLQTVGAEIETQFVDRDGNAVQTATTQQILANLAKEGWEVDCQKGDLITALVDSMGNKIFYELGRHNIEVATIAIAPDSVLSVTNQCLSQLYAAAERFDAKPYFAPILNGIEDLLVIPDERDAIWLQLDGRDVLAPLARTSAVQFTFSVAPTDALPILNRFGNQIDSFLANYPQDAIWKKYVANSAAGYLPNRYGGPLKFESLTNYCQSLARHSVVQGPHLVSLANIDSLNISLFLRSIWWHFRLKRYNNALCIEVRPLPRLADDQIPNQLQMVLDIVRA
ncbi:MAG: hypothetical protein WA087_00645 [Candidatus Saccharimonadales bacterium]